MSFLNEWKENKEYFSLLELMARLSNLFSDSSIPFVHYRITENLFCKYYNAENLSRSDMAYDAKTGAFGVGIKTFTLKNNSSTEKIAEFNSISSELKKYKGYDLACRLAVARNERMKLGQRLYRILDGCYHIIGRVENGLTVFNSSYSLLNAEKIRVISENEKSIQFEDGEDVYTYNRSKSTLFKKFTIPKNAEDCEQIPVSIISEPYEILKKLIDIEEYHGTKMDAISDIKKLAGVIAPQKELKLGKDFVILKLFSERCNGVPPKSGLNQWNAGGRARDANEVYIPIPSLIHERFPDFFPPRKTSFTLHLPDGSEMSAKICQDNGKALMSNPNKDLGKWLLRDILHLEEGELLTMEKLNLFGFDSVIVFKINPRNFKIDVRRVSPYCSYDE